MGEEEAKEEEEAEVDEEGSLKGKEAGGSCCHDSFSNRPRVNYKRWGGGHVRSTCRPLFLSTSTTSTSAIYWSCILSRRIGRASRKENMRDETSGAWM